MSEANEIILCDGKYEVHPMVGAGWSVVDSETGQVRSEFSDKQDAIDLATELNKETSEAEEILKASKGQESEIEIYWDKQDPANVGPTYRYRNGSDSGPLEFVRWSESESVEGYELDHYFDQHDRYIGPDQHGVYPIFEA